MNYLVVFFDKTYMQHFIIVQTSSPEDAKSLVNSLEQVKEVISVWQEAI